jgi:hypothetical protein
MDARRSKPKPDSAFAQHCRGRGNGIKPIRQNATSGNGYGSAGIVRGPLRSIGHDDANAYGTRRLLPGGDRIGYRGIVRV